MSRRHRSLTLFLLITGLAGLSGCASQTAGPSDGIVRARETSADGTWLTLSNGCKLLDPSKEPPADVKVFWKGPCAGGMAEGKGSLEQIWNNGNQWVRSEEASFGQGRRQGAWTTQNSNGAKQVRSYKDGKLHGLSAQLNPNGTYQEYFFVANRRIMTWLVAYSYPDGRYCSGDCQERGPSNNFVVVARAEGKEPVTQACGTDAAACRRIVRSVVKETMRRVMEKANPSAPQPTTP
jgi:hypothetical protein